MWVSDESLKAIIENEFKDSLNKHGHAFQNALVKAITMSPVRERPNSILASLARWDPVLCGEQGLEARHQRVNLDGF
jgi:hypothetical protein